MLMQQDLIDKLRAAQRHLVEAARALDGASVNIRTLLEAIERERRAPHTKNHDGDESHED